jgi:uncharacterized zinc-type alcohol dehydrogenase-like protein
MLLAIPMHLYEDGAPPFSITEVTDWDQVLRSYLVIVQDATLNYTGSLGLGGLVHMSVKFASALGRTRHPLTTSPNKTARRLGAHEVVVSRNQAEMRKDQTSFDFILDTVRPSTT